MGFLITCFLFCILCALVLFLSKISVYGWHRPWSWWVSDSNLIYVNRGLFHTLFQSPMTVFEFVYRMRFDGYVQSEFIGIIKSEIATAICKHKKVPKWIDQVCTKKQYDLFIETGES